MILFFIFWRLFWRSCEETGALYHSIVPFPPQNHFVNITTLEAVIHSFLKLLLLQLQSRNNKHL